MQIENDTSGREHSISLLLDAPLELAWDVWTKPEHIKRWWGPNGFTNTITKMEMKPGGEWVFTMHGPDGNTYPNKTIFREVVEHKKIVHEHHDPNFIAVIEFAAAAIRHLYPGIKCMKQKNCLKLLRSITKQATVLSRQLKS